ncbi:hypothetical protein TYRP_016869 [Tyrophagus putrescentiae]|nr:hypothetical protein TYRP_016869 [Tyrophagus putrescentiae]
MKGVLEVGRKWQIYHISSIAAIKVDVAAAELGAAASTVLRCGFEHQAVRPVVEQVNWIVSEWKSKGESSVGQLMGQVSKAALLSAALRARDKACSVHTSTSYLKSGQLFALAWGSAVGGREQRANERGFPQSVASFGGGPAQRQVKRGSGRDAACNGKALTLALRSLLKLLTSADDVSSAQDSCPGVRTAARLSTVAVQTLCSMTQNGQLSDHEWQPLEDEAKAQRTNSTSTLRLPEFELLEQQQQHNNSSETKLADLNFNVFSPAEEVPLEQRILLYASSGVKTSERRLPALFLSPFENAGIVVSDPTENVDYLEHLPRLVTAYVPSLHHPAIVFNLPNAPFHAVLTPLVEAIDGLPHLKRLSSLTIRQLPHCASFHLHASCQHHLSHL